MLLFSDLHLSVKTFATCMKVLRSVHAAAKQRNVPIGFLGDFFDHVYNKGTLPVNILNALMRFFETEWSVPMIMIPGNHDYFDASETEHGLTPFKYASKYITVIDEPTVLHRQLWVPWRRCNQTLENILQQHQEVDVIFGHFDIVGFKLNPTKLSTEGLVHSVFPQDKPIYTGHYHTPQVHKNIRYLGSPYQLSLSEAEDKKSLIIVDHLYQVKEQLPLDIGPRQYKWSVTELTTRNSILRPGDRVVVSASATDSVLAIVSELEVRGVDIHIKKKIAPVSTRIEQQDTLTPQQLFQNYGQRTKIDCESIAFKQVQAWISTEPNTYLAVASTVQPTKMEISGFGPFKGQITIALEGQGFTLISGECNESKNASNGAGKSMLSAGAWLWACTGMIDGRGTVSFGGSVLHTDSTNARVMVSGTTGGRAWSISRSINERKKQKLLFTMDNNDCTRSTISATQKAISSELFGLDMTASHLHAWLLRNSVWSQMSVPRWLDASDTQAKNEISPFANMQCWLALYDRAKSEHTTVKSTVQKLTAALEFATHQRNTAQLFYEKQLIDKQTWETERQVMLDTATSDIGKVTVIPEPVKPAVVVSGLKSRIRQNRTQLATAIARKELIPPTDSNLPPLPNMEILKQENEQQMSKKYQAVHALRQSRCELQHFIASGECVTCHRPFEIDNNRTIDLEKQVDTAVQEVAQTAEQAQVSQKKYTDAVRLVQQHKNAKTLVCLTQDIDRYTTEETLLKSQEAEAAIIETQMQEYRLLKQQYEHSVQSAKTAAQFLQRVQQMTCPVRLSTVDIQKAEDNMTVIRSQQATALEKEQQMKAAVGWLGPRGIQTYAMEYTVQKLSAITTVWLQRFFKTDDIELRAHFDDTERLVRQVVCPKHAGIMSGGQWRRAQLASFMAWREMTDNSFPLLVMDEACTSMDQDGISSVQETLKEWCEENEQRSCLFITHENSQHRDTSIYQNHVRILHKRGRSTLIETAPSKKQKISST